MNLYTYCHNNPIVGIDPSGNIFVPRRTLETYINLEPLPTAKTDYLNGNSVSVYLGVHQVKFGPIPTGNYHSSVIIYASHDSDIYKENGDMFNNSYADGVSYATLGAGGVFNLKADLNRKKDKNLNIKKEMINLNISDETTVGQLFELHNNYTTKQSSSKTKYSYFPGMFNDSSKYYNSNSYAAGLLKAAGVENIPTPENKAPGFKKPLPNYKFGIHGGGRKR